MTQSKGLRYPVTQEWCERVREALDRRGRGAMGKMADELGVPRSQLSEVLGCVYETSPLVEAVHEYLGWSPPLPPTAAVDAGGAVNGYSRLSSDHRRLLDTASEILHGVHGEQAQRALVEFLRLCRSY